MPSGGSGGVLLCEKDRGREGVQPAQSMARSGRAGESGQGADRTDQRGGETARNDGASCPGGW